MCTYILNIPLQFLHTNTSPSSPTVSFQTISTLLTECVEWKRMEQNKRKLKEETPVLGDNCYSPQYAAWRCCCHPFQWLNRQPRKEKANKKDNCITNGKNKIDKPSVKIRDEKSRSWYLYLAVNQQTQFRVAHRARSFGRRPGLSVRVTLHT